MPERAVLELEQLVGHGRGQAFDPRDAVARCDDGSDLFATGRLRRVVPDEAIQGFADFLWTNREFCHRLRFLLYLGGKCVQL